MIKENNKVEKEQGQVSGGAGKLTLTTNTKIKDYKDLIVWQKAMDAVAMVYVLVKKLPKEETYALSDQIRRAAVSIPSNIAEGQARNSHKEFNQFLAIAKGSKAELETQLLLCVKISYLTETDIEEIMNILQEVGKMLNALQNKLITNTDNYDKFKQRAIAHKESLESRNRHCRRRSRFY